MICGGQFANEVSTSEPLTVHVLDAPGCNYAPSTVPEHVFEGGRVPQ